MENLRFWDRKAKHLKKDLDQLFVKLDSIRASDHEPIRRNFLKIKQDQFSLDQDLTFILSVTKKHQYLNTRESTLLHWSKDFALKTEKMYRSYMTSMTMLLWAKLVQSRSLNFNSYAPTPLEMPDELKNAHTKILKVEKQLKAQLDVLAKRRAELTKRYETLAVIKSNRESYIYMDNFNPSHHPIMKTLRACQDYFMRGNPLRGGITLNPYNDKFSFLIAATQKTRILQENTLSKQNLLPNLENILDQFDYLGIGSNSPHEKI